MRTFEYEALASNGKLQTGKIDGSSERSVRDQLRKKNLIPVNIFSQARPKLRSRKVIQNSWNFLKAGNKLYSSKLKLSQLTLFTQQMATLLESGMPIAQCLTVMIEQSDKKNISQWLIRIKNNVTEGFGLGKAIENSGYKISEDYIATISAGEESGYLPQVLNRLADSVSQKEKVTKKIQTAFIYPVIMIAFCFFIVIFLLTGVLPKVTSIFVDLDKALPGITQALISLSNWLLSYWQLLVVVLLVSLFVSHQLLKKRQNKFKLHLFLMKMPFLGVWFIDIASAKWTRTLAVLVESGVPVVKSLSISSAVVNFLPFKKAVNQLTEKVRKGHGISRSMGENKIFPVLLMHLVASGEQSSSLGKMLTKAAEQYESKLENQIETLLSLLEPMLIIIMGGVIMLVVLAIMLPIFEMNQLLA